MKTNFKNPKAFSLIEISIVILIIGILVAGVTQSSRLIAKSKLQTAQTLTKSSPVAGVRGLLFWFEPTLDESFISSETNDQTVITQWNDINPQNTVKYNATAGQKTNSALVSYNMAPGGTSGNTSGPTYIVNGINNLPTLRFTNNASTSYRYLVGDINAKNLPKGAMVWFLVIKYRSGTGEILSRICPDTSGAPMNPCSPGSVSLGNPLFGMQVVGGALAAFLRSDLGSFPSISPSHAYSPGYTMTANNSYIITFERKYGSAFTVYVNGSSSYSGNAIKADNGDPITLDPFKLGRNNINDTDNLDADVSEFIFFGDNVNKVNREAIEDYLGKKYGIAVSHN
ncbi:MAG: prepilin-type N-terminal cleavage/methylation domain-containing protein [Rickettsiales bacterium]|nr:prepilin-type N-terminal cleavage/methylation domain-containing protein [Rickettsiales bacterium]